MLNLSGRGAQSQAEYSERLRLLVAKQEIEIARLKKGYWVEGAGANKEYVTGQDVSTKSLKK